jgi:hypothetical protein
MTKQIQELEQDQEEIELDEIGKEDYGFIIGPDGELKHLFTPDEFLLDPPPIVKKILKLLGIADINSLDFDGNDTVH